MPAKTKTAAAPASAAEDYVSVPTTGEQIRQIPLRLLHPSSYNPRERTDDAADKELAESIARDGMLENIIARPHPKIAGEYEIIAGARRRRALGWLLKDGRITEASTWPVLVHDCDDREALRIAGIENVQRESMTPLEEGRWLSNMVKAGFSTEQLTGLISKKIRWVQKRIKLVETIAPAAAEALRDNKITVRQAEAIAEAPTPQKQASLLKEIGQGRIATETQIKEAITRELPPERAARFDLALYTGEFRTGKGGRFFADAEQFEKLQDAWIDAKEAELKGKWAWVERRYQERGQWFHDWEYGESKDPAKAGAIIEIDRESGVKVHVGLLKEKDRPAVTATRERKANGGQAELPVTKALMVYSHDQKSGALQAAILADAERNASARVAKIMVCIALLGDSRTVAIKNDQLGRDDRALSPDVAATLARFRERLDGLLVKPKGKSGDFAHEDSADDSGRLHFKGWSYEREKVAAEAFRLLHKMSDADLGKLFGALVASRCGSFSGFNPELGDPPLAQEAAAALKIDMAASWGASKTGWADYLKICKKGRLVGLTRAMPKLGIDPVAAESKRTAALAAEILEAVQAKKLHGEVPPELLFGDKAAIERALKTKRVNTHGRAAPAKAKGSAGAKGKAAAKGKAKARGKSAGGKVVKFPGGKVKAKAKAPAKAKTPAKARAGAKASARRAA